VLLALSAGAPARAHPHTPSETKSMACRTVGTWLDPASGETFTSAQVLRPVAERKIVLLGESHHVIEHHRWQLQVLAGLHALRSDLVVGFEMFPRSVQSALDAWSGGKYSDSEFLAESRWREVWGFDPELYLPLFRFVRRNRLPMVSLNVERALVARVGEAGWSAVPAEEREGVSDPAPASESYRRSLAEVYALKIEQGIVELPTQEAEESAEDERDEEALIAEILESDQFRHFVESQLTWDRAMAQALHEARADQPDALVAGVLGQGHVESGYGVPHQLADLGEKSVSVLLPVEAGPACEALGPDAADAVFVLAPAAHATDAAPRPRLGIRVERADGGVRVIDVTEGSVAEAAGLAAGDVITAAAGTPLDGVAALITIVQRQAPGTWLPLDVTREGETLQIVARFPTVFDHPE
jgi:uncharacterized iron-regulated protein